MKVNKTLIKECSDLMDKHGLLELEYLEGDCKIRLIKNVSNYNQSFLTKTNTDDADKPLDHISKEIDKSLKAPLVGTIYLKPEPTAKPFIEIGQKVKIGQILLIIEAMKTMNEIKSDKNGEVKKIYAKDASPVEFGEPLVLIE